MKILIINGSPKGEKSVSIQTMKYLETLHNEHEFKYLNVGQKIKYFEKDFSEPSKLIAWSDLIIFSYPVYIFLAPYQLTRFIELIQENNIALKDKNVSQFTTSKHFFDVTAHRWMQENMIDMNAKFYRGLSADMDDLLTKKGQKEARDFFSQLMFDIQNENYDKSPRPLKQDIKDFISTSSAVEKTIDKTVVLVSCYKENDLNMIEMIKEYKAKAPYKVVEYNIMDIKFQGGCLGCFSCTRSGHCVYKDGFEQFLKDKVLNQADAIVYAFKIFNHFGYSNYKNYDDRQFCNGHRMLAEGTPVSYLVSGNLANENNIKMILEGRSEVGGTYLTGIVSDEQNVSENIANLIKNTTFAMENKLSRPKNFYGIGGTYIFRDLVYVMRGIMPLDHKHYKKTGVYDSLPHKHKREMFKMLLIGLLMKSKYSQKKMKGKMNDYIIAPYQKVIKKAQVKNG